jgi:hypothetical protein
LTLYQHSTVVEATLRSDLIKVRFVHNSSQWITAHARSHEAEANKWKRLTWRILWNRTQRLQLNTVRLLLLLLFITHLSGSRKGCPKSCVRTSVENWGTLAWSHIAEIIWVQDIDNTKFFENTTTQLLLACRVVFSWLRFLFFPYFCHWKTSKVQYTNIMCVVALVSDSAIKVRKDLMTTELLLHVALVWKVFHLENSPSSFLPIRIWSPTLSLPSL